MGGRCLSIAELVSKLVFSASQLSSLLNSLQVFQRHVQLQQFGLMFYAMTNPHSYNTIGGLS